MRYFAYGSNLWTPRLRERVPSAVARGMAELAGHALRFHKRGRDGSAKCDAFGTGHPSDRVIGVVFEIRDSEKPGLDAAEGLGRGYAEVALRVTMGSEQVDVFSYRAEPGYIDPTLPVFEWYKALVLAGAREHGLPADYLRMLEAVRAVPDPDRERALRMGRLLGTRETRSPLSL